mgnify:CR=1 FL=1
MDKKALLVKRNELANFGEKLEKIAKEDVDVQKIFDLIEA